MKEFNNEDSLFVAVLTGEGGRAFSAGGDFKEQTTYVGTDDDPRRSNSGDTHYDWSNAPKPVIAAIDGYAFAGDQPPATRLPNGVTNVQRGNT